MTPNPTTMRLSDPIGYALHLMDLHGYRHIPVVDPGGRVVKVVSFRAALEFFTQLYDNGANGS
ncbi:MAG: CBS domain-containing protein [Gemmatimonadota bacterium]|nr:CBS domain-containing protein [Gemmatimonadota bacterium]